MKIYFIDDSLENGKVKGFHHKLDGSYGHSRIADKIELYEKLGLKSPVYTNCPTILNKVADQDIFFWTGTRFENKNKLINKDKQKGGKNLFDLFINGDIQHALKKDWRY